MGTFLGVPIRRKIVFWEYPNFGKLLYNTEDMVRAYGVRFARMVDLGGM